jgi:2-oxoglutarate ferredoxin oxidoreductase subunit alpha
MVGQGDMMQARWGSHGDYEIIAICPQSPQEAFDLTIHAFNLAEIYRNPVLVMMDECVGHMTERVVIPPADEIEVVPRRLTKRTKEEFWPYKFLDENMVPEFARVGDGYKFHATGLTHDERGYPVMSEEVQERCVRRLVDKIRLNAEKIIRYEDIDTQDADVVVVAYGITARVARMGIELAKEEGVKVGLLRLIVVWPFAERKIRELAQRVKGFVVPEINYGQIVYEVERCSAGKARVVSVPHLGGGVHNPDAIANAIVEVAK